MPERRISYVVEKARGLHDVYKCGDIGIRAGTTAKLLDHLLRKIASNLRHLNRVREPRPHRSIGVKRKYLRLLLESAECSRVYHPALIALGGNQRASQPGGCRTK